MLQIVSSTASHPVLSTLRFLKKFHSAIIVTMESKDAVKINLNQDQWVIQMREGLDIQDDEEKEFCICVFNVPKELLAVKPEAYIPQCVSIGPYHHWRSELYEMERYKVVAARRYQKRIEGHKFESAVEEVKKYEWQIRRCYHKYLDYNDEALAWLMALDASFVLECLQFYVKQADKSSSEVSSDVNQLGKVLDLSGKSATHNEILRDLMKLENQVPLFVLQKLLELQLGSETMAEERLRNLVRLACKELSPFMFKMPDTNSRLRVEERGHILEVLYYSLVPASAAMEDNDSTPLKGDENEQKQPPPDTTRVTRALNLLWKALSSLNIRPVRSLMALLQRVMNLRFLRALKGPFTIVFKSWTSTEKTEDDQDGNGQASSVLETQPTRDELDIASVSSLYSAGIKFLPTDGDLASIRFDHRTATLYLPKVKLDANTEVILRNLVAFEASANPGAFIFTRYTDFMNGMIDSEEDVRLLRKSGIIYNYLESERMATNLWNGMGKCVKLTKVEKLDEVIREVNKYYRRRWSVAVVECMKTYVFDSWKILSLLAALILLLVTCLQAFCSVYECKQWFNDTNLVEE